MTADVRPLSTLTIFALCKRTIVKARWNQQVAHSAGLHPYMGQKRKEVNKHLWQRP